MYKYIFGEYSKRSGKKICATCYYLDVGGIKGHRVCSQCFYHSNWKRRGNNV